MMYERKEGKKGEMKLRLRQKGELFCLGDSGAAIGDWDYALVWASKMALAERPHDGGTL